MITGVLILAVMVMLGAPLFTIIAVSAIYGFYQADIDLSVIAIEIYRIVDTPILIAIPLFTLPVMCLVRVKHPIVW